MKNLKNNSKAHVSAITSVDVQDERDATVWQLVDIDQSFPHVTGDR